MPTKGDKPPKRSRWIKGTLTRPKDNPFTCTEAERAGIIDDLKASPGYRWCMVSLETHLDATMHYHFMVCFKNPVRESTVGDMRALFGKLSSCNDIGMGNGYKNQWVGYIAKGGWPSHPDTPVDYTVDGEADVDIGSCLRSFKKKRRAKLLQEHEGTSDRPAVQKESEVIHWLNEYMTKHGYKVNYHTRRLFGVQWLDFFEAIEAEGFSDLFGERGLKLAEINITSDTHYRLPMWRPCLDYVRFSDGIYSISQGLFVADDDQESSELREVLMESFNRCEPVRIYDFPCPVPNLHLPTLFLKLVARMQWDIAHFRDDYGRQFKDKKRRHKGLLIHGIPHGGKSTLLEPFKDVFRDVIGEWTDDGGYAYSNIARHSRVYSEEVNVFSRMHNVNQMKKVLEGVEFETARKHKAPIACIPKTMMIVTNDTPPGHGSNVHSDAILDRLDVYESMRPISSTEVDPNFIDLVRQESAKVLVWATSADRPKIVPVEVPTAELIFEDSCPAPIPCPKCKPGCGKEKGHKGRHIALTSKIKARSPVAAT